jgi:hypothetical protein
VRECIVLAQNNFQLATDEAFKAASVACLSDLWTAEAWMRRGSSLPPSDFPWNQFLAENIIACLPNGPLALSDLAFLTMVRAEDR